MKLSYLEGFRGYMSLWVFIYHTLGFLPEIHSNNIAIKFLKDGILPVIAFVILSGFVTHILLDKRESFKVYIYRRFLRLFPIYLFAFIISLIMLDISFWVLEHLPTENPKIQFRKDLIESYFNSSKLLNILSHITLTHGLFPNKFFPFTYTIMGQSWSLTLEWQFYIFIPIVYHLIKEKKTSHIIASILFIALIFFAHRYMPQKSFLPYMIEYFLIGFFSYSLYKKYTKDKVIYLMFYLAILASYFFFFKHWHYSVLTIIWFIILYFQTSPNIISKLILGSKIPQFLGTISYSVYCNHMIVLFLTGGGLELLGIKAPILFSALLIIISLSFTIILSYLTYNFIEKPFIKIGRNYANKHKN